MSLAVSYTHLDVYKRQPCEDGEAPGGYLQYALALLLAEGNLVLLAEPLQVPRQMRSVKADLAAGQLAHPGGDVLLIIVKGAVSYTHLDVYKRQAPGPLRCATMARVA